MTLANKITVLRIIAVPIFMIAMIQGYVRVAQAIFVFSVLSDAVDGIVARIRGERTPLGTFLDPMADKLLLVAAFVTLTYLRQIPVWVFIAVLSRDCLIVMGWSLVYILTQNSKIEPRALGKTTTALQMAFVIGKLFSVSSVFMTGLLALMLAATVLSAIDYVWVGNQRLGHLK